MTVMKQALAVGLSALALNMLACSENGVAPAGSGPQPHPFALQSNAPSPSPWQSEPTGNGGNRFGPIVGPDGKSIWNFGTDPLHGYVGAAFRLDLASNTQQEFLLPSGATVSGYGAGPDGKVWYCGPGNVGNISTDGIVTNYSEPIDTACYSITTGTDGNLWMTNYLAENSQCAGGSIDEMTPNGDFTEYALSGMCPSTMARSTKDRLLWFCYETNANFGAGTFDPVTHRVALFPFTGIKAWGCLSMNTGVDGNAYVTSTYGNFHGNSEILRITPTGAIRRFINTPVDEGFDANLQDTRELWLIGNDWYLDSWSITSHQTTSYGSPSPPQFVGAAPIVGPDMNVWYSGGVYLRRILTTVPQSATLAIGGQQSFSVAETDCPQCVWSTVSSAPGVASVSTVEGGGFTVTGVSAGSAVITVSDKRFNSVRVPISVQ